MKIFRKPIFTGFAPNLTAFDALTAASFLFLPWRWLRLKNGESARLAEEWLKKYFSTKHCLVFDSGRSALYFILKSLNLTHGDEVLLQAYTCVVVANSVIHAGGKPIYVDAGDDFNMDCADLEKKITPRVKVLIIQHTFGKPANFDLLLKAAKERGLFVVEDCAHALGIKYDGRMLGTFGDVGFFSFGSDKPISCGRGGGVITNNDSIAEKLSKFQSALPPARLEKILQHLFSFIIFWISKPLYNVGVGKCLLWCAGKLKLMNKIIYSKEKCGQAVGFYPSLLPDCLAKILLNQLAQLERFNQHRQKISQIYSQTIHNPKIKLPAYDANTTFLRFPILTSQPKQLFNTAKREGIILGTWYDTPIAPKDADYSAVQYHAGSCSNAEKLAAESINLPTDISITAKDASRVADLVNKF